MKTALIIVLSVIVVVLIIGRLGNSPNHDEVVADKLLAMADALSAVELPNNEYALSDSAAREQSIRSCKRLEIAAADLRSETEGAEYFTAEHYYYIAADQVVGAAGHWQQSLQYVGMGAMESAKEEARRANNDIQEANRIMTIANKLK